MSRSICFFCASMTAALVPSPLEICQSDEEDERGDEG